MNLVICFVKVVVGGFKIVEIVVFGVNNLFLNFMFYIFLVNKVKNIRYVINSFLGFVFLWMAYLIRVIFFVEI